MKCNRTCDGATFDTSAANYILLEVILTFMLLEVTLLIMIMTLIMIIIMTLVLLLLLDHTDLGPDDPSLLTMRILLRGNGLFWQIARRH